MSGAVWVFAHDGGRPPRVVIVNNSTDHPTLALPVEVITAAFGSAIMGWRVVEGIEAACDMSMYITRGRHETLAPDVIIRVTNPRRRGPST